MNTREDISGIYNGELVSSVREDVQLGKIEVKVLHEHLCKVYLKNDDQELLIRGRVEKTEEGLLIIVNEKVTEDFIVNGLPGFVKTNPKYHGGYLHNLDGFFLNVKFKYFNGDLEEIYFFGRAEVPAFS
jgi:hypothetical protein